MRVRFKALTGSLLATASILTVSTAIDASRANAQEDPTGSRQVKYETVPDAVDRVTTGKSREFFENRTLERQIDFLFGFGTLIDGTFAENEIATDAKVFGAFYKDFLNQQVSTTPIIRTPDLNNPFNTSVLSSTSVTNRIVTTELVYERLPLK